MKPTFAMPSLPSATLRLLGVLLLGLALAVPTFSFAEVAEARPSKRASSKSKSPSRARAHRGAPAGTKKARVTRHRSGVKRGSYVARHSHRTTYRRSYYRPRTTVYLGPGYYYGPGYYRSGYYRSGYSARPSEPAEEGTTVVARRDRYPDLGLAFEMGSVGTGAEGAGGVIAVGMQLRFLEDRYGDLQLGFHVGSPASAEEEELQESEEAAFAAMSLDKRLFLPMFGRAVRPYGLVGVGYQTLANQGGGSLNLGAGLEVKLDDALGFYGNYTYRYLPFALEHRSEWGQVLEIEGLHSAFAGVAFYF